MQEHYHYYNLGFVFYLMYNTNKDNIRECDIFSSLLNDRSTILQEVHFF